MPREFAVLAVEEMNDVARLRLWQRHVRHTSRSLDLSAEERTFIEAFLDRRSGFGANSEAVVSFGRTALDVFDRDRAVLLFGNLGIAMRPSPAAGPGGDVGTHAAPGGADCSCSRVSDFCDTITGPEASCDATKCDWSNLGCGWLWLQACSGRCVMGQ